MVKKHPAVADAAAFALAAEVGDEEVALAVARCPKPVIAQVHGFCIGVATQMAVCCDITVVSEDAHIGWPAVPLGGGYLSPFSAWLIGPKKAKELSFIAGSRMSETKLLTTNRKALTINLDGGCYGTIAEIGAGQEVARIFFQAGGASGSIAKTISAYDMTFSDAIYGKAPRYVSRERLSQMLDHEYRLLWERLADKRKSAERKRGRQRPTRDD